MITRPRRALSTRKGTWYLTYYEDGVRKEKSLRTTLRKEALRMRDEFFLGCSEHVSARRGAGRYVYYRKPWVVKVSGTFVGEADTEEEAEQMRDIYLAANP